jgi:predicted TIM-barrel fold metal-dependent hydrolase
MNNPDAALAEIDRALDTLGATGVQMFSNVAGRPLDGPALRPLFARMAERDLPIWLHPARPAVPDYGGEPRSRYDLWWAFGRLARRPIDCFRMFYGDTALFCAERILFGTDMPFDLERGPGFIRDTIAAMERMRASDAERRAIYEGNARRLLRLPPAR